MEAVIRAVLDKLPDPIRDEVAALLEEGERAKAAAKFEDMGYDECETCRQARLRRAFRARRDAADRMGRA